MSMLQKCFEDVLTRAKDAARLDAARIDRVIGRSYELGKRHNREVREYTMLDYVAEVKRA